MTVEQFRDKIILTMKPFFRCPDMVTEITPKFGDQKFTGSD
jgi:hypothetical protein